VTSGEPSGDRVSERWSQWRAGNSLEEYYARWRLLDEAGQSPHGEADFIESFQPRTVLDAGCGMGRVAIELARRGLDVVGVDLDDDLLAFARRTEPSIEWINADLASMQLGRRFDVVAMAGNVMVFCRPQDRGDIIGSAVAHLVPGGLLVNGFELEHRSDALTIGEYDQLCAACDLEPTERWATWSRDPYEGGTYAVSVHRLVSAD
jgi:2-polyprenyl-3-methyl-5-hydroxy-6-metoxy-1,4-benzoquinol methylase